MPFASITDRQSPKSRKASPPQRSSTSYRRQECHDATNNSSSRARFDQSLCTTTTFRNFVPASRLCRHSKQPSPFPHCSLFRSFFLSFYPFSLLLCLRRDSVRQGSHQKSPTPLFKLEQQLNSGVLSGRFANPRVATAGKQGVRRRLVETPGAVRRGFCPMAAPGRYRGKGP